MTTLNSLSLLTHILYIAELTPLREGIYCDVNVLWAKLFELFEKYMYGVTVTNTWRHDQYLPAKKDKLLYMHIQNTQAVPNIENHVGTQLKYNNIYIFI